jgi:chorismate mutase/prephenate dehydratase
MKKENKGKQLTKLRSSINKVDGKIVNLLTERRKLSLKVIKEKERVKLPVREKEREAEVINRIMSIAEKKKLDTLFVSGIFQEIIEDSVKLQQKFVKKADKEFKDNPEVKVALQGIEGSYSYLAAEKYFGKMGKGITLFSKNKFEEVIQSVESGEADFALLPIENTTSGGINEVYDLLLNTSLSITGEEIQKVDHCFASVKNVPIKKIKKVYAHYQAAAQCSRFLESLPGCSVEYFADTAMSFRKIKEEGNPYFAAIAGEGAAKIFGLKVLKTNIANQRDNYTRFLIASREPVSVEKKLRSKTSLAMVIPNKAGSLADALSVFKKSKINLTRIESRPIQGNPWDEMFYLDFEGNFSPMEIQKVLIKISSHTRFVKILGSYTACEFERC